MKSRNATLFLLLLLKISLIASMFSDDLKFQRMLNTEAYNNGIIQDEDGLIWISSEFKGLFSYNGNRLKGVKIGNSDSVQMISSIFVDNEGLIWFFLQGQGLYCYNKKPVLLKTTNPEKAILTLLTPLMKTEKDLFG